MKARKWYKSTYNIIENLLNIIGYIRPHTRHEPSQKNNNQEPKHKHESKIIPNPFLVLNSEVICIPLEL